MVQELEKKQLLEIQYPWTGRGAGQDIRARALAGHWSRVIKFFLNEKELVRFGLMRERTM